MRFRRGFGVGFALVVMIGVSSAVPAFAVDHNTVVGHVVGTAPFDFSGCAFVHQHYLGTVDTPASGDATIDVDVCVDFAAHAFVATGTFTLVTTQGTLTGTANGRLPLNAVLRVPFAFTLRVSGGSDAVGTGTRLYFRGIWKSDQAAGGPIHGRLGTQAP